ncbi:MULTISPECIES: hypothetical protein [unclassified Nocardioides]|uniref:hypothetical protein n=1 Tax=unclassified Nocardioides TaxID=2615069 RepID=UPI0009F070F8|nr:MULTISPECIES: hypothetical protein [unclassified Nocardioides]GAW52073.1 uncharacterized protein (Precursor) [Nocardioides sp. PD653-B2]GAW57196.1 uncharacterized protein (Precursor) [Nocardioides sp. PD653]
MRHWTLFLGTLAVLTGCTTPSGSAEPADRDVQASGGVLGLDLPRGWTSAPDLAEPPIVLVARGATDDDQLVVSIAEHEDGAEQQAITTSAALADSYDIVCERLDDSDFTDGPVFDCPDRTRKPWVHKVLVPVAGDGASALMLVQTRADSYDEAVALVGPIVESVVWD